MSLSVSSTSKTVIAFDVYGTLIDLSNVKSTLTSVFGKSVDTNTIEKVSQTWRDKQLEYSFRRGLMRQYQSFATCTQQALEYTLKCFRIKLSQAKINILISSYAKLPAFAEVDKALKLYDREQFSLVAFSNGLEQSVYELLSYAGIMSHFDALISVDAIQSFKPNPDVYHYLLDYMGVDTAWLISSNPFDVIGAKSAGLKVAWLKRDKDAVFDPWGVSPNVVSNNLIELSGIIKILECKTV